MLDPRQVRENAEAIAEQLKKKGYEFPLAAFKALEQERKQIQVETENLQQERNTRSKSIGQAKAQGQDIAPLLAEVGELGAKLDQSKEKLNERSEERRVGKECLSRCSSRGGPDQ